MTDQKDWRQEVEKLLERYRFHVIKGFEITKNEALAKAPLMENKPEVITHTITRLIRTSVEIIVAAVDNSSETEENVVADIRELFSTSRDQQIRDSLADRSPVPIFKRKYMKGPEDGPKQPA